METETLFNHNLSEECGFAILGCCCTFCSMGPCRINLFSSTPGKTKCGFSPSQVAVSQLLIHLLVEGGANALAKEQNYEKPFFIPNSLYQELVDNDANLFSQLTGWIAKGSNADLSEGIRLLFHYSLLIILNNYRKKREYKITFASEDFLSASFLKVKEALKENKQSFLEAGSLDELWNFLDSNKDAGNKVVLLPEVSKNRILSLVFGLAACGFTVITSLPAVLAGDKDIKNKIEAYLSDTGSGQIFDLHNNIDTILNSLS